MYLKTKGKKIALGKENNESQIIICRKERIKEKSQCYANKCR